MARVSGKLLIVGFAALLVGALALLRLIGEDPRTSVAISPAESVTDQRPLPGAGDGDAARKGIADRTVSEARRSVRPAIADGVIIATDEEIPYTPEGRIIAVADLDVLREATPPTDELVRACVAKHAGPKFSGSLVTTFTVARKRDKNGQFVVETESTGFEEEGSTFTQPEALVECLHKTALAMKWPKSTSPIATWARRRISVENGAMIENFVFVHGYIR